jgi:hypothetical protein
LIYRLPGALDLIQARVWILDEKQTIGESWRERSILLDGKEIGGRSETESLPLEKGSVVLSISRRSARENQSVRVNRR